MNILQLTYCSLLSFVACRSLPTSLRGLLGGGRAAHVLAEIGGITELSTDVLDVIPDLSCSWGSALGTNQRIDAGTQLRHGVLDVGALRVTSSEEGSVHSNQDPRATLEENGRKQDADPEKDLQCRNNGHGGIIVLFNESTDSVSQWVADTLRGGTIGGGRRRLDDGNQVGAGVSSDVED